jgi:hypothetical protein
LDRNQAPDLVIAGAHRGEDQHSDFAIRLIKGVPGSQRIARCGGGGGSA